MTSTVTPLAPAAGRGRPIDASDKGGRAGRPSVGGCNRVEAPAPERGTRSASALPPSPAAAALLPGTTSTTDLSESTGAPAPWCALKESSRLPAANGSEGTSTHSPLASAVAVPTIRSPSSTVTVASGAARPARTVSPLGLTRTMSKLGREGAGFASWLGRMAGVSVAVSAGRPATVGSASSAPGSRLIQILSATARSTIASPARPQIQGRFTEPVPADRSAEACDYTGREDGPTSKGGSGRRMLDGFHGLEVMGDRLAVLVGHLAAAVAHGVDHLAADPVAVGSRAVGQEIEDVVLGPIADAGLRVRRDVGHRIGAG